jgi:hypothetical protein
MSEALPKDNRNSHREHTGPFLVQIWLQVLSIWYSERSYPSSQIHHWHFGMALVVAELGSVRNVKAVGTGVLTESPILNKIARLARDREQCRRRGKGQITNRYIGAQIRTQRWLRVQQDSRRRTVD